MGIVGRSNDQLHKDLDTAEGNVGVLQTDVGILQIDVATLQTTIISSTYACTLGAGVNCAINPVLGYASYTRIGKFITVNVRGKFDSLAAGLSTISFSLPSGLEASGYLSSYRGNGASFSETPYSFLVAGVWLTSALGGSFAIIADSAITNNFSLNLEYTIL